MNYKTLARHIENAPAGYTILVNAINLSPRAVDTLRKYIQAGTLVPDSEELARAVAPEYIPEYMSGEFILPQMAYTKA